MTRRPAPAVRVKQLTANRRHRVWHAAARRSTHNVWPNARRGVRPRGSSNNSRPRASPARVPQRSSKSCRGPCDLGDRTSANRWANRSPAADLAWKSTWRRATRCSNSCTTSRDRRSACPPCEPSSRPYRDASWPICRGGTARSGVGGTHSTASNSPGTSQARSGPWTSLNPCSRLTASSRTCWRSATWPAIANWRGGPCGARRPRTCCRCCRSCSRRMVHPWSSRTTTVRPSSRRSFGRCCPKPPSRSSSRQFASRNTMAPWNAPTAS